MSNKNALLKGIKWLSEKDFACVRKHRSPKDAIAPYCKEIIACSENIFVCLDVNQNDIVISDKNNGAFHCLLMVKKAARHLIAMNLLKSEELEKLLTYFRPILAILNISPSSSLTLHPILRHNISLRFLTRS